MDVRGLYIDAYELATGIRFNGYHVGSGNNPIWTTITGGALYASFDATFYAISFRAGTGDLYTIAVSGFFKEPYHYVPWLSDRAGNKTYFSPGNGSGLGIYAFWTLKETASEDGRLWYAPGEKTLRSTLPPW